MKSLEVIELIRQQASLIIGMLEHLLSLKGFKEQQYSIIKKIIASLQKVRNNELSELRKVFGDNNYDTYSDIDFDYDSDKLSNRPDVVIKDIIEQSSIFQRLILKIPGEKGCNDIQSMIIDRLQDKIREWRNLELDDLKNIFFNEKGVNNVNNS